MFFIDESGIITNKKPSAENHKHQYFVISFVQTDNSKRLKTVYQRSLTKLRKYYPDFFAGLENPKEPKGSELMPFMKLHLIEDLITFTDIKIAHMVVDNREIEERFRKNTSRSFNYLIKLIILNTPLTSSDQHNLQLNIDNRNVAVGDLKDLQKYLSTELISGYGLTNSVGVSYFDSQHTCSIQVADLFANVIYQRYRYKDKSFPEHRNQSIILKKKPVHPYTMEFIYQRLLSSGRLVTPFVYPVNEKTQVAATASLYKC